MIKHEVKKIIKMKIFKGTALLMSGISLININSLVKSNAKTIEPEIIEIVEEDSISYKTDNMYISKLLSNNNLSANDKLLLTRFDGYFIDNIYINEEEVSKKLQTVKILRINDESIPYAAEYLKDTNTIIIYNSNDYALYHEVLHLTGSISSDNNISGFINEGMTLLLEIEYFYSNNYFEMKNDPRINTVKMLSEIITPDKMLEAYTKNDVTIIENELLKIYSDRTMVESLFNEMGKYDIIYSNRIDALDGINIYTEENRKEISKKLSFYYKQKFNEDIENDILMNEYNNRLLKGFHDADTNIIKSYFSSEKKLSDGAPCIIYFYNISENKEFSEYIPIYKYLGEESSNDTFSSCKWYKKIKN